MTSTDTVVGIAGAVLLAAVMVGVFLYEYNNAPATAPTDADRMQRFKTDYATLNATGDLDGDGIANYLDDDLDGDGASNLNDTATGVHLGFQATMPPPTPPATTAPPMKFVFRVEEGHAGAALTLTYNSTLPAPVAQVPRSPTLEVIVTGPDGTVSTTPQTSQAGTAVTSTTTTPGLAPGEYVVRVSQTVAGRATPFAVSLHLDYGAGHPAEP